MNKKPMILIILDGWGYRKEKDYNALAIANTPNWDKLCAKYPNTLLGCSGTTVGLPENQMGNSEVGHMHIGSGRIIDQSLTRINKSIKNQEFEHNPILDEAFKTKKPIHIMGLLSPGGVHSHQEHIFALIEAAKKRDITVFIHAFLDGRDTPPKSARDSIVKLQNLLEGTNSKITSICGRYYAMDRDKRWARIQKAYDLLTDQSDLKFDNAIKALDAAYERGENDEFVQPTHCTNSPITIKDNDIVIFMNFRADRARQITHAITDKSFDGFQRNKLLKLNKFITLTEYSKQFKLSVLYPPLTITGSLGEIIANSNMNQLRIAETEKYAHVTYFFNGGVEEPFANEDRIMIPSPRVKSYDLKPEMSANEITNKLIESLPKYDLIVCNFANADMLGHTGNINATKDAIETLDNCLGKIIKESTKIGGNVVITSDHGNAECMYNTNLSQPHTAHTNNPVPFIYVGKSAKISNENGNLADIAPTILYLMGLDKPNSMTGNSLVTYL